MRKALRPLLILSLFSLQAQTVPAPPCGMRPVPDWPGVGQPAAVKAWSKQESGATWTPPPCTGWSGTGFSTLVSVAARFPHQQDAQDLLRKIGAVSSLGGVRYWSATHKQWQTLITKASALSGAKDAAARADFSVSELQPGTTVHYQQTDNLTGTGIWKLHIMEASAGRIVFDITNVSPLKYMLLTAFHPGDAQAIYFLEKESDGVWKFYSLTRSSRNANSMATANEASAINRAVAFYRHIAGIPTDQEPPAAR